MKTVKQIANEVIDGLWGNGEERKIKIEKAGYNYNDVQGAVNAILNGTKDEIVDSPFQIGGGVLEVTVDLKKYRSIKLIFEV